MYTFVSMCVLFHILFHCGLLQDIEYSSLGCTIGHCHLYKTSLPRSLGFVFFSNAPSKLTKIDHKLLHETSLNSFFFFFFAISWAAPAAHGGSQARGRIGAASAGLGHSHSNLGSEPRLQPSPQPQQGRII